MRRIEKLCKTIEKKDKNLEKIAMVIYVLGHMFVSYFHEPWYDEAVAWQIARCASLQEILFVRPHYEGHPPLWHLILVPFAKLGVPYELSLSFISLLFAGGAVALILWKAPFPRIIRLLLPFTYFFFYQYGVISRPYCVVMFAFMLLAIAYRDRNEHPWKYVLCLMLLCQTSAYGIVIAGGLAIVWMLEIWKLSAHKVVYFLKDIRVLCLLILLLVAIIEILMILPEKNTYAIDGVMERFNGSNLSSSLAYLVLALPLETTVTFINKNYSLTPEIDYIFISVCCVGVLVWYLLIDYGKKRKTVATLLIPYAMFAFFSSAIYMTAHHLGIGLLLIVYWFWITLDRNEKIEVFQNDLIYGKRQKKLYILVGAIIFFVSIGWTVSSCICDIGGSYAHGRKEAEFLKENGLDNYEIMIAWEVMSDENNQASDVKINNTLGDSVLAYFDNNIFYNYNLGSNEQRYSINTIASEIETEQIMSKWEETIPDVLFLNPKIELIYGETISMDDYKLVYSQIHNRVFKGLPYYYRSEIHVSNELSAELELKEVERATPFMLKILGNTEG